MLYAEYISPVGKMFITSDGQAITGVYFDGQRYLPDFKNMTKCVTSPCFSEAVRWLDIYFGSKIPDFMPKINPHGTEFQKSVWTCLTMIKYGQTVTYGGLAKALGTSARAVGNAVGHNPISVIVPCHRVIGADGSLTGYAGGTEIKQKLLNIEKKPL